MMKQRKTVGIILSVLLAAAGTALLVGYVRGAEQRALEGETTVDVLVATTAIPKGTKAEAVAAMVKTEQVPAKVAASGAVASTSSVAGRVAAVDILPGEQLVQSRFATVAEAAKVNVPPGALQVTVALDALRAVGGKVREGDSVAVAASFDDPQTTRLLLQKVPVTDVRTEQGARITGPVDGPAATGTVLVTLAVDAPAAERVIFAAEYGRLWLSWEPKEANEAGTKLQTRAVVNQ